MAPCKLLSGTEPLLLQGSLFVISASALLARKHCDTARRSWLEFGLDSSKQLIGAAWAHGLNLLAAILPSALSFSPSQLHPGPCELYFMNIFLDTTLGVAIEALLLRALVGCVAHEQLESGEYYDAKDGSFRLSAFAWQLGAWLVVVTTMKACITLILAIDLEAWEALAEGILAPVRDDPRLLTVVMILAPGLLKTLQFLCTDAFLRRKRRAPPATPRTPARAQLDDDEAIE